MALKEDVVPRRADKVLFRLALSTGVMVSTIKTKILGAYITAILAVFVWGPLIALHGYRQWWVVMFYASFASSAIAGSISHYRILRRNRKS